MNLYSPLVRHLATTKGHIITSPDIYRRWRQTFLGTSNATTYCSVEDFQ